MNQNTLITTAPGAPGGHPAMKEEAKNLITFDENIGVARRDDLATHPTALGVDTLSDVDPDPTLKPRGGGVKQETQSSEMDQNESTNEMTSFLTEINKLNDNLSHRKASIKARISELNRELKILKEQRKSPKDIVNYIAKQRSLREALAGLLGAQKVGDSKVLDSIKEHLSELEEREGLEGQKKRERKALLKKSEKVPWFDPYQGSFEQHEGQSFGYQPRGMFDYDEMKASSEYKDDLDNRMMYPSQRPSSPKNPNVGDDDLPDLDNFLNKKDSDVFNPGLKPIKKELDAESDLFAGFPEEKEPKVDLAELDNDLFGDSFEDQQEESSESEGKLDSSITKDFEDSGLENSSKDFMPMPGFMNAQMYGQYMMDPGMYPPNFSPYMKTDGEMGGYMGYEGDFYGANFKNGLKSDKPQMRGRKRNKYKMLPTDLKRKAVELARYKSPKYAANFYSVPLKSLKRWMKVGCERKKGGGRKTKDPIMEKNLYAWYIDMKTRGEVVTAKMIKDKAIELTNCNDFIASKGWLDKFKVRFNLEISKESAKEGHKRRFNIPEVKKRPNLGYEPSYDDIEPLTSVRRSLNKSVKQESEDNYLGEMGSIKVRPEPSDWASKTHNIKSETGEDIFRGGSELPSIFATKPTDQFKGRIDNSSNVISLPLCDADNSD